MIFPDRAPASLPESGASIDSTVGNNGSLDRSASLASVSPLSPTTYLTDDEDGEEVRARCHVKRFILLVTVWQGGVDPAKFAWLRNYQADGLGSASSVHSKPKPKPVNRACVHCKRAHLACETQRPCKRCLHLGKASTCVDVEHKKRGRPKNAKPQVNSGTPPFVVF